MKTNKLISLSAIALILFSNHIFAQGGALNEQLNPLITGVPSLTISPDARAGGMGDVGAATLGDEYAQYWNPSKYIFNESGGGLAISYTPWLRALVKDINLVYASGFYKFGQRPRQAISASLRNFSMGEVTLVDESGVDRGLSAKPNEISVDVAYSLALAQKWAAGVAMRFIWSDLGGGMRDDDFRPGAAVAADIFTTYSTPITMKSGDANLSVGLSLTNIGSKIRYNDTYQYFIPTTLRLGASFLIPFDAHQSLTVSADVSKLTVPTRPLPPRQNPNVTEEEYEQARQKYNDTNPIVGIFTSFGDAPGGFNEEMREIMWALGVEYAYNKQFFVRAGYFDEHSTKGGRKFFSVGVGFKLHIFRLDAGYVISLAPQNPLNNTLRFSLAFDLAGLKALAK